DMRNHRDLAWVGGCAFLFSACARSALPAPVPPAPAHPVSACERLHAGGAERLGSVRQSSSVALAQGKSAPSGKPRVVAYVADTDEPTLRTIDVETRQEIASSPLKGRPEQVLVLADGRVAVSLRASNAVEVLEPSADDAALASRCVIDTRAEPVALAATPDDATILVTSGWGRAVTAFDAKTMTSKFEVSVPRDPRGIIVSDDGERAFVAHVVEARMSVIDLTTMDHAVRNVDVRARLASEPDVEPSARKGCQGFALTKVDGAGDSKAKMIDRVFAPMVSVNAGDGSESSGYGSESPSEISEVAVVDASAERTLTRAVRLPSSGTALAECLLPRAAAYDDGALYVTCLGIDALLKLDARSLDPARAELKRWPVAGGPTGVAVDHANHRAVVWSQFDREVAIVDLEGEAPPARLAVSRRAAGITANVALGRKLFHQMGDARISSDGRACASCHPDGKEDAITWSTPDGPRQTPMLAGRLADTAPYGWMGSSDKLKDHLKKTFERLSGSGLEGAELSALVDYISSLTPPIERKLPADRDKLVVRGRELFESAGTACGTCHDAGHAFVDGVRHVVMAGLVRSPGDEGFDTPSLRFVAGTAPYFHDGRYKTLDDVLIAPDHAMGSSTHLSRQDRAALVAYLETL
ncbi:MAG TPA: hypothetical protein VJT73_21840, partial [Polyangiaceae bacterium]|nr:hypothetical protein [Polyangiaceae bacterium]